MKIFVYSLLFFSFLHAQSGGPPQGLSAGIGFIERTAIFKNPENDTFPIPFINWSNDTLYFRGLTLGYFLYKGYPQINLILQPVMLEVENDNGTYNEGISKRYRTLNAGVDVIFPTKWFMIGLQFQHDILGINKGWITSLDFRKRISITTKFSLTPGFQVQYFSQNYIDYYYGIDNDEVRFGRPKYEPSGEFTWGPTMMSMYQLENQWAIMIIGRYAKFDSEIGASPLTKRDDQFSFLFGATKSF